MRYTVNEDIQFPTDIFNKCYNLDNDKWTLNRAMNEFQFSLSRSKTVHEYWYDDVMEIINAKIPEVNAENFQWKLKHAFPNGNGNKGWVGTNVSFEQFNRYLTHGWEYGAKKIADALDDPSLVIPPAKSVRRRRVRAPFGDSVDIHRVMRGELDRAWDARHREMSVRKSARNVLIMLNNAFNCNVSSSEAMWSGACAAWLSNVLTASGRNVTIEYTSNGFGALNNNDAVCFSMTLKKYDEPVAFDKLAAAAALPGFERVYGFKAILAHPGKVCSSLGRGNDWYIPSHVKGYADEVLYVSGIRNQQSAINFLKRNLARMEDDNV